jgi:osmotically-inducible protein OsmY
MIRIPHFKAIDLITLLAGPLGAQTAHKTPPSTDSQIEAQVQQILGSEHAFRGSSILSAVNKGVVTLTGNVRSEAEKAETPFTQPQSPTSC